MAAGGANVSVVPSNGEKVTVDLDAEIVARTRDELGAHDESDAAVVERALNAYLLGRLLDTTQAKSGLSEGEADKLATAEVRAARRERSSAA
jgi:Arc/MetJ family transcription regulator